MVLALNVSVYFCKLLPLYMNGNLPVGIGMHVFAMICDLMNSSSLLLISTAGKDFTSHEVILFSLSLLLLGLSLLFIFGSEIY
eukprot:UN3889